MQNNILDNKLFNTVSEELEQLKAELEADESSSHSAGTVVALMRLIPETQGESLSYLRDSSLFKEWLLLPLDSERFPSLVQLQKTLSELAHQSEHDGLTGLANRRRFDRELDVEVERAHRHKSSVSLALVDLDNFKRINDTYGHTCGDEVIKGLAEILQEITRRYDLAARVGGEEFALLLPGTGLGRAQRMLDRILNAMRDKIFIWEGAEFSVTCSIGLACYKGRASLHATQLYDIADKALYEAKNNGKDQVHTAPIPDLAQPIPEKTLVQSNEKQFLFSGLK